MTATCPVCDAPQDEGLLCHACCTALERELAAVPGIVADLDIALSRQARIGGGGKGGLARERMPINLGALAAIDDLTNTLTTWARDVGEGHGWDWRSRLSAAEMATNVLLGRIPEIRRHRAVAELHDEIIDAVRQARRAIDRPAEQQFLGTCYVPDPEHEDQPCDADLYARAGASSATCKVCGITHDVAERRAWLLQQAAELLCTVREAARYLGEVGHIRVTEASIRGYLHRKRLAYRPGTSTIRLGDLLTVVVDESERRSA